MAEWRAVALPAGGDGGRKSLEPLFLDVAGNK